MEEIGDFKVIFYIALAIIYFIFSRKKKALPKKDDTSNHPKPVSTSSSLPKPPSDYKPKPLVKNLTKTISPEKEAKRDKDPYTLGDVLTQFGNAKVERKKTEIVPVSKDSLETTHVKSVDYDEALKDEEPAVIEGGGSKPVFQPDEHYVSKQGQNKYAEMLKDPEWAKAAFIAGEIFNRRVY